MTKRGGIKYGATGGLANTAPREYSVEEWRTLLELLTSPSPPQLVSSDCKEGSEGWRPVNRRGCLLARLVQRLCAQYRWKEAAQALEVLLIGRYPADQLLYKAGMLLHENLATPERTNFFIRHSRCLLVADKKEIALEYIVYCLKHQRHAHLRTFFQEHLKVDRKVLRPNEKLDAFVRGYLGLLDYLQWLPHAARTGHNDSIDADGETAGGESYEELTSVASALDKWRALFPTDEESSGSACRETVDIFLTKMLQLLLRYERADEAEEIADVYVDSHGDDCLHALHYARALSQELERRHVTQGEESPDTTSSHQVELLQRICEADPTDPQVLDYVRHIERSEPGVEGVAECLRLLADFVDCPDNQDSAEAWRMLCRIAACSSKSDDAAVATCGSRLWQERFGYWLPYHFSPRLLRGSGDVWLLKAAFLQAIGETTGNAGAYISAVEEKILEHDVALLERYREVQDRMLCTPGHEDSGLDDLLVEARRLKN
ncbi:uncharacterized protein LOC144141842 [Haemaphysalis longicornis]